MCKGSKGGMWLALGIVCQSLNFTNLAINFLAHKGLDVVILANCCTKYWPAFHSDVDIGVFEDIVG